MLFQGQTMTSRLPTEETQQFDFHQRELQTYLMALNNIWMQEAISQSFLN